MSIDQSTARSRSEQPLSSDEIRTEFLQFWQDRAGLVVPSASLIPSSDDPTVLLTIAGMQPFVPYFLGQQEPPRPRMASVQKCFRTVDIDEVGDPRHLTFFEMLGNFSIGDYFKAEVIPWALELLTERFGIPRTDLWVTVHQTDDEAEQIWQQAGIPVDRIVRLGDADNWWGPPGKSGPCGPNTEIYVAQGSGYGCGFPGDPPGCDCGRLEIWNLVFMQFFQDEHGARTPLPRKNVDTGMGLERTAAVLQKAHTVYESDLFMPIIRVAERIGGIVYGQEEGTDYALRVLADHGRGMTFLVADGVVPGATGREYVLRRIIRRAIRFGRRLGVERAFVGEIADAVMARMADHYPELHRDRARIRQVLESEEELFSRTLRAGNAQLERLVAEARASSSAVLSGRRVFDLYQTYGFPPELTEEVAREEGLDLDWEGYRAALNEEQERAKSRAAYTHAEHKGDNEFPDLPRTEFLAWQEREWEARVQGVRAADGVMRIVLEASPFYPEGGGQVGDTGRIVTGGGVFQVEDTRFDGAGHVVHVGRILEGMVQSGELARAAVDAARRERTMRHHTVTHLLHRALKDVLGEGTSQQGSLVSPDVARFDFNCARPMSPEQIQAVLSIINDRAMQDLPVHWEIMPLQLAQKSGAVMMFGEKYGEDVRVVSIGDYSKELCGGTHTHHSGQLGLAVIASEAGIGSGKRRIVALAGPAALAFYNQRVRLLEDLAERTGARGPDDLLARVESLQADLEVARKELERLQHQQAHAEAGRIAAGARDTGGVKVVAQQVPGADEESLKRLVDAVREDIGSGVVVLGTVMGGKPRFVVGVTKDLAGSRLDAGRILGDVARAAGGGGGGRPDFATGGGGDPARVRAALDQAYTVIGAALG